MRESAHYFHWRQRDGFHNYNRCFVHGFQVASGIHHTLILTRAGRVFGAGKCQSGQLGGPKAQFVKSGFVEPEMVTALLEHVVVEVACGSNFNVCRTKKGKVFVFGSNQMWVAFA